MPSFRCVAALVAILPSPGFAQSPAPPPAPPPACEAPEHRQLDFWVGRWDVYVTGTDQRVARSLIENLYGGCAIRENWMPLGGAGGGGSLNSWRPAERRWRQAWTDSAGNWRDFYGGMEGEAMVLATTVPAPIPDGRMALFGIRFTRGADGTVRQQGTFSLDNGATWRPRYDLTYRRSSGD